MRDGWYRIPARIRLRRRAEYLALYATQRCGREGGRISWYAPIAKVTRRRRASLLPGEPDHLRAGEWYWKLELGERKKLSPPVQNRLRRRLAFAYTTLSRLLRAREIGQLFAIPPLEEIARRALDAAGIPARFQFAVREGRRCRFRLDFAIFCQKGRIALECDHSRWHQQPSRKQQDRLRDRWLRKRGWTVIHFSEDAILMEPLTMIGELEKLIVSLGGPAEDIPSPRPGR